MHGRYLRGTMGPLTPRRAARALLALALASCADPEPPGPGVTTVTDSAGVRIVTTAIPLARPPFVVDDAPSLAIGEEEGDDVLQLHRVSDATVLADGRVVVANAGSGELRLFDSTGHYLSRTGRHGAGPGEFAPWSLPRLFQRRGELLATDPEVSRLHAFDATPALIATRAFTITQEIPRPQLRDVLDDGTWLAMAFDGGGALRGPPGSVIGTTFAVALYDAQGRFRRRFGRFEGSRRYVNTVGDITHYPHLPFTTPATVRAHGDQVLVLRGGLAEVELWDTTGTLRTVMRWHRERTRAADLYAAYRTQALAGRAMASERDRLLYGAFYEKELPLPEYVPLYDDAEVDAARRIWVRRYRLPLDSGPDRWDVLEPGGQWLGTVATPKGVEVHEIGADHLIGRARDSLGVERVVRHGIRGRVR